MKVSAALMLRPSAVAHSSSWVVRIREKSFMSGSDISSSSQISCVIGWQCCRVVCEPGRTGHVEPQLRLDGVRERERERARERDGGAAAAAAADALRSAPSRCVPEENMDESSLLDLLECSVCLERLDTSAKVLPCQHTFCRRCLENIVSSRHELRCPECRILVDCAVDDLPANILLVRLLDGIKQRPRNGGGRPSLAGCATGVSASPPGTAVRDLPVATRSSPVKVGALLLPLARTSLPSLPEASALGRTEWLVCALRITHTAS
ncbi:E3 ubiquitin-protein ligase SH3RF3 [Labeo rohita]|uniref:E3 ubiquitin-protein ligase SH3RF3 n=1 Tax=Labeo rohita TaxID=84645 RepID=A0ABQ8MDJ8_LABRO|nr:E3 ubiquitin-protein ligase SH3RF3 [Labeo rohita]